MVRAEVPSLVDWHLRCANSNGKFVLLLLLVSFKERDGILFDREIDRYHCGSFPHYELGFIGQPDVVSTRGRQGRGSDDLARQALAFRADTDDRGDRHLELVILRHS